MAEYDLTQKTYDIIRVDVKPAFSNGRRGKKNLTLELVLTEKSIELFNPPCKILQDYGVSVKCGGGRLELPAHAAVAVFSEGINIKGVVGGPVMISGKDCSIDMEVRNDSHYILSTRTKGNLFVNGKEYQTKGMWNEYGKNYLDLKERFEREYIMNPQLQPLQGDLFSLGVCIAYGVVRVLNSRGPITLVEKQVVPNLVAELRRREPDKWSYLMDLEFAEKLELFDKAAGLLVKINKK